MIFLSINDQYLYIATGSKAMEKITDSKLANIRTRYMNPLLKKGKYHAALVAGLDEISKLVSPFSITYDYVAVVAALIFLCIVLVLIFKCLWAVLTNIYWYFTVGIYKKKC